MKRIYLDHNATTPLAAEALDAMLPFMREDYGNPSSMHWYGQRARSAAEQAREQVAKLIGAEASEIVFTASGTESDNMALRGVAARASEPRRRILTTPVEHHAVVHTVGRSATRATRSSSWRWTATAGSIWTRSSAPSTSGRRSSP